MDCRAQAGRGTSVADVIDQMEKQMFFKTTIWKIPVYKKENGAIQQQIWIIQLSLDPPKDLVQIWIKSKNILFWFLLIYFIKIIKLKTGVHGQISTINSLPDNDCVNRQSGSLQTLEN